MALNTTYGCHQCISTSSCSHSAKPTSSPLPISSKSKHFSKNGGPIIIFLLIQSPSSLSSVSHLTQHTRETLSLWPMWSHLLHPLHCPCDSNHTGPPAVILGCLVPLFCVQMSGLHPDRFALKSIPMPTPSLSLPHPLYTSSYHHHCLTLHPIFWLFILSLAPKGKLQGDRSFYLVCWHIDSTRVTAWHVTDTQYLSGYFYLKRMKKK